MGTKTAKKVVKKVAATAASKASVEKKRRALKESVENYAVALQYMAPAQSASDDAQRVANEALLAFAMRDEQKSIEARLAIALAKLLLEQSAPQWSVISTSDNR